jgi:hypothetical protein
VSEEWEQPSTFVRALFPGHAEYPGRIASGSKRNGRICFSQSLVSTDFSAPESFPQGMLRILPSKLQLCLDHSGHAPRLAGRL